MRVRPKGTLPQAKTGAQDIMGRSVDVWSLGKDLRRKCIPVRKFSCATEDEG